MGDQQRVDDVRSLPAGRVLAVDERGVGLRMTWHLDRGFINLSLWRSDRCVETFHLTPGDASRLVSFVVGGLAETAVVAPAATVSSLRPVARVRPAEQLQHAGRRFRGGVARALRELAAAVQPPAPDATSPEGGRAPSRR